MSSPGGHYGEQCELGPTADGCYLSKMLTHFRFAGTSKNVTKMDVSFGEYISASVYFKCSEFKPHSGPDTSPANGGVCTKMPTKPLPVALWFHPSSHDSGYDEGYIEAQSGTGIYYDLANAGFAVIAWDATSFGSRGYEMNGAAGGPQGGNGLPLFYRRYPHWSLLGKLVHDGLAALDLASTGQQPSTQHPGFDPPQGLPPFDPTQIYAVGYDIGARAALYAAALDDGKRLKGVVSINGWTPMRTDTNASSTGGIRRLWDWHGMQPALGFFDGKEELLPYDMDDVIAASGVPTLIYQQDYDREADVKGVAAAVAKAAAAGANVMLQTAAQVNSLDDAAHDAVLSWLKVQSGLQRPWPPTGPPDAYQNFGLVECASNGTAPGQERAMRWQRNASSGSLYEQKWHHRLTISCAQAAKFPPMSCGALPLDEHVVLSEAATKASDGWNHTLNLKWTVNAAKKEVREARGKCLSSIPNAWGANKPNVVATANCSASRARWTALGDGRLQHTISGKCLGIW